MSSGGEHSDMKKVHRFCPFTKESLVAIESRINRCNVEGTRLKTDLDIGSDGFPEHYSIPHHEDRLQPDPMLEVGKPLPRSLARDFPSKLITTPIEDIDKYYENERTFVVINKAKDIFRFSATNSLFFLSPFNLLRHIAIYILVHPAFSFLVIATILVNFMFMTTPNNESDESTETIFASIYIVELCIKVIAMGFILEKFTYLRDPWNWLDFIVIALAWISILLRNIYCCQDCGCVTIGVALGNLIVLRIFRVLRALKYVTIIPGLAIIIGAVIESVKNLRDVIIFILFSLSVFAILGLQIYMGVLTQICVRNPDSSLNLTWEEYVSNYSIAKENWLTEDENYILCGTSSGARQCPPNSTCVQGLRPNPDYGYTNFDSFPWALLTAFRLMTQDFWEDLYQMVLKTAGPWHMCFFFVIIFFGSVFLMNMILAIVVMSYDEMQKKAEEEEEAKVAEDAELQEEIDAAAEAMANKLNSPDSDECLSKKDSASPFADPHKQTIIKMKERDEVEKPCFKECCLANCEKCIDTFCVWNCCKCWMRFQKIVSLIVFDPFMELFITLCIVANTIFMAMHHHNMNSSFEKFLNYGNYFFTTTFAIEAGLKIISLSPKYYFCERWNTFDFVIVALSLLDLGIEGVPGLLVLRSIRLLRVFRLAKSLTTMNLLISIMGQTIGAFIILTFVLGIITFIFAVIGMQFFGKYYDENKEMFPDGVVPDWNFRDLVHSVMLVFRAFCGEWIETMWDCMHVAGGKCIPFYLATVVIGNFVVRNLFLALLLSAFYASNLSQALSDTAYIKKMQEAIDRFSRAGNWLKKKIMPIRAKHTNQVVDQANDLRGELGEATIADNGKKILMKDLNNSMQRTMSCDPSVTNQRNQTKTNKDIEQTGNNKIHSLNDDEKNNKAENIEKGLVVFVFPKEANDLSLDSGEEKKDISTENMKTTGNDLDTDKIETATSKIIMPEYPANCYPDCCYARFPFCKGSDTLLWLKWKEARRKCFVLVEHKYFEGVIIAIILISSFALAAEDVNLKYRPLLKEVLQYMDKIFTILFLIEMLLKWFAFGFKKYFTDAWCVLDFVVVLVSMVNLVANCLGAASIQVFKTMRCLRLLRTLRALSGFRGMRVILKTLVQAIPAIFNVLLVCLFIWLIFAIMGVQLMCGKFYACRDEEGERMNALVIPNKFVCSERNLTWSNQKINFDNVLNAYLSLFQVATFKGWIDIMKGGIDSTGEDLQPESESKMYMYFYFVLFIIFGVFFTLNLLVGVIVNSYNEQKRKDSSLQGRTMEIFMTEDQKKYYNAMKKMGSKHAKAIPRPQFKLQAIVFDLITNKKFDMTVMIFICLYTFVMAFDHYNPTPLFDTTLESLNIFFIAIFTAECMLKIFALRMYYFKDPWNIFDFVVVTLSILGIVLKDLIAKYYVPPLLLRVVRVVKMDRVLRLIKGARGIRISLFALVMSLPALFNICLLLFLVMFIYALFGMSFFMNVRHRAYIGENMNFETFGQSMILLFQLSTTAGWDGVLFAIMEEDDCNQGDDGDCGNRNIAVAYLVSYLIISFFIIMNMCIAVILENYSKATEDVQEGLTDDDYDMYYGIWQNFDPDGTQFIKYSALSTFLDTLEEPLQIPKPNKYKIISMDIPICEGDLVFCVDILNALTKDFFQRKGLDIEETVKLVEVPKAIEGYKPISSTLLRQRAIGMEAEEAPAGRW